MSYDLQNFYKATVSLDWSIGTGNFYVSVKPTVSTGWVVVSPNNATLREIVKFTATGTDSNGDYITISVRGVGGTSEQTHSIGEPVNMNITAEYWDDMNDAIADIVASGVSNANTTTMGGVEIATDAEVDAGTATGGTGASIVLTPANVNASHNIPFVVPGTDGNIMKSDGTDWISATLSSILPIPAFQQMIPIDGVTGSGGWGGTASSSDGSVLIVLISGSNDLFRYARDSISGTYTLTHAVNTTPGGSFANITVLGNYVYLFYDNNTVMGCYRYDLATMANETSITMPSIDMSSTNYSIGCWSDGTFCYVTQSKASTTTYKLALSGTTFSTSSTSTTSGWPAPTANLYDGTSVYVSQNFGTSSTDCTISKLTNVDGTSKTDTIKKLTTFSGSTADGAILVNIDSTRMYIGRIETTYNATTSIRAFMILYPITKP